MRTLKLIKGLIVRYEGDYLRKQSYFNPYPSELMNFDIKNIWRGRSHWKK